MQKQLRYGCPVLLLARQHSQTVYLTNYLGFQPQSQVGSHLVVHDKLMMIQPQPTTDYSKQYSRLKATISKIRQKKEITKVQKDRLRLLMQSVEVQKQHNLKRFGSMQGYPVRFGDRVILLFEKTNKFIEIQQFQKNLKGKITVTKQIYQATVFRIMPAFKMNRLDSPVADNQILLTCDGGLFLSFFTDFKFRIQRSLTFEYPACNYQSVSPKRSWLHLAFQPQIWTFEALKNDSSSIKQGQPVLLKLVQANSYLCCDWHVFEQGVQNCYLNSSNVLDVNCIWKIFQQDSKCVSVSPIVYEQSAGPKYILRHLVTDKFLSVSKDTLCLIGALDRNKQAASISFLKTIVDSKQTMMDKDLIILQVEQSMVITKGRQRPINSHKQLSAKYLTQFRPQEGQLNGYHNYFDKSERIYRSIRNIAVLQPGGVNDLASCIQVLSIKSQDQQLIFYLKDCLKRMLLLRGQVISKRLGQQQVRRAMALLESLCVQCEKVRIRQLCYSFRIIYLVNDIIYYFLKGYNQPSQLALLSGSLVRFVRTCYILLEAVSKQHTLNQISSAQWFKLHLQIARLETQSGVQLGAFQYLQRLIVDNQMLLEQKIKASTFKSLVRLMQGRNANIYKGLKRLLICNGRALKSSQDKMVRVFRQREFQSQLASLQRDLRIRFKERVFELEQLFYNEPIFAQVIDSLQIIHHLCSNRNKDSILYFETHFPPDQALQLILCDRYPPVFRAKLIEIVRLVWVDREPLERQYLPSIILMDESKRKNKSKDTALDSLVKSLKIFLRVFFQNFSSEIEKRSLNMSCLRLLKDLFSLTCFNNQLQILTNMLAELLNKRLDNEMSLVVIQIFQDVLYLKFNKILVNIFKDQNSLDQQSLGSLVNNSQVQIQEYHYIKHIQSLQKTLNLKGLLATGFRRSFLLVLIQTQDINLSRKALSLLYSVLNEQVWFARVAEKSILASEQQSLQIWREFFKTLKVVQNSSKNSQEWLFTYHQNFKQEQYIKNLHRLNQIIYQYSLESHFITKLKNVISSMNLGPKLFLLLEENRSTIEAEHYSEQQLEVLSKIVQLSCRIMSTYITSFQSKINFKKQLQLVCFFLRIKLTCKAHFFIKAVLIDHDELLNDKILVEEVVKTIAFVVHWLRHKGMMEQATPYLQCLIVIRTLYSSTIKFNRNLIIRYLISNDYNKVLLSKQQLQTLSQQLTGLAGQGAVSPLLNYFTGLASVLFELSLQYSFPEDAQFQLIYSLQTIMNLIQITGLYLLLKRNLVMLAFQLLKFKEARGLLFDYYFLTLLAGIQSDLKVIKCAKFQQDSELLSIERAEDYLMKSVLSGVMLFFDKISENIQFLNLLVSTCFHLIKVRKQIGINQESESCYRELKIFVVEVNSKSKEELAGLRGVLQQLQHRLQLIVPEYSIQLNKMQLSQDQNNIFEKLGDQSNPKVKKEGKQFAQLFFTDLEENNVTLNLNLFKVILRHFSEFDPKEQFSTHVIRSFKIVIQRGVDSDTSIHCWDTAFISKFAHKIDNLVSQLLNLNVFKPLLRACLECRDQADTMIQLFQLLSCFFCTNNKKIIQSFIGKFEREKIEQLFSIITSKLLSYMRELQSLLNIKRNQSELSKSRPSTRLLISYIQGSVKDQQKLLRQKINNKIFQCKVIISLLHYLCNHQLFKKVLLHLFFKEIIVAIIDLINNIDLQFQQTGPLVISALDFINKVLQSGNRQAQDILVLDFMIGLPLNKTMSVLLTSIESNQWTDRLQMAVIKTLKNLAQNRERDICYIHKLNQTLNLERIMELMEVQKEKLEQLIKQDHSELHSIHFQLYFIYLKLSHADSQFRFLEFKYEKTLLFFKENSQSVEVVVDQQLTLLHFPIDRRFISSRDSLFKKLPLFKKDNVQENHSRFMKACLQVLVSQQVRFLDRSFLSFQSVRNASHLLVILINVLLFLQYSKVQYLVILVLKILQVALAIILVVWAASKKFPIMLYKNLLRGSLKANKMALSIDPEFLQNLRRIGISFKQFQSSRNKLKWHDKLKFNFSNLLMLFEDVEFNYFLFFYLTCSLLGTYYTDLAFAFLLLDLVISRSVFRGLLLVLTKNWNQLQVTILITILFCYFYAVIIFFYFNTMSIQVVVDRQQQLCMSPGQCFFYVLYRGVIAGGGLGEILLKSDQFKQSLLVAVLQISFFLLIKLLMLNLIMGIIVDTFAQNREDGLQLKKDFCPICGQDSPSLSRLNIVLEHHIQHEHALFKYFLLMGYLKDRSDLQGAMKSILQKIKNHDNSWLPRFQCITKVI